MATSRKTPGKTTTPKKPAATTRARATAKKAPSGTGASAGGGAEAGGESAKKPTKAASTARPAKAAASVAASAPVSGPASTGSTGAVRESANALARDLDGLVEVGREVLGIKDLRPGQREGLEHILARRDVLAIMPTGAGKSLLYQLPAIALGGLVVVVSPLLALISDQVSKLRTRGATALRVDSTLTPKQRKDMMTLAGKPGGKLLLTTPERMADPEFRKALREAAGPDGIRLFVCDEAHCVSQWGHDFRPSYLMLRQAIEDLGHPPVLATTATAPPHVKEDILHQLGIEDAEVVTTSFARPNLQYEVIALDGEDDKKKIVLSLVKKLKRPGIIYCATVKTVDDLAEELGRHGLPVAQYHGRMTKSQREDQQDRFMATGSDLIMVATNAFGLGVDKADIRWVMHYHVPGSLEQYAQEAGRGGRDGKPSRCVLLFSPDDVAIQEYFLQGTYPRMGQVLDVIAALAAYSGEGRPPTLMELAASGGCGQSRTRTVLALAKEEGWVVEEDGRFRLSDPPPPHEVVRGKAKEYEKRRIADRRRLDALLDYVRASGCRSQEILSYLGEEDPPGCGRCDNDLKPAVEARAHAVRATALEDAIRRRRDLDDGLEPQPLPVRTRRTRTRVISLDEPDAAAAAPPALLPAAVAAVVSGGRGQAHVRGQAQAWPVPAPVPVADDEVSEFDEKPTEVVARPAVLDAREREIAALAEDQKFDQSGVARVARTAPVSAPVPVDDADEDETAGDDAEDDDDDVDTDGVEVEGDDEGDDEDDDGEEGDEDDDEDEDDDDDLGRTAAEIAADDSDLPEGEITVLKRKKRPKPPKLRPGQQPQPATALAGDGTRKKRRRRRKKKKAFPPRSAFTSPVLVVEPGRSARPGGAPSRPVSVSVSSTDHEAPAQPEAESPAVALHAPDEDRSAPMPPTPSVAPGGPRGPAGPVIEYVRRTMKIASAPIASATPNDAQRRHGGDRGGGGAGGPRRGYTAGGPEGRRRRGPGGGRGALSTRGPGAGRDARPGRGGGQGRPMGPNPRGAMGQPGAGPILPRPPQQPRPQQGLGNGNPGFDEGPDGRKRRRRRKRRGGGAGASPPVSSPGLGFWQTPGGAQRPSPVLASGAPRPAGVPGEPSLPGQGKRKRRRRRRRGGGGGGPDGTPSGGAPSGGAPPSGPASGG